MRGGLFGAKSELTCVLWPIGSLGADELHLELLQLATQALQTRWLEGLAKLQLSWSAEAGNKN